MRFVDKPYTMQQLLLLSLFLSLSVQAQVTTSEILPLEERYLFTTPIYKTVLTDAVFRDGIHQQADIISTIPKGQTVKLIARDRDSYRAIYNNTAGFIHFVYIDGDYKAFKAAKYPHGPQVVSIDYENEPDSLIIYGKVKVDSPLKEEPVLSSLTTYLIPGGTIVKITKYNMGYWQAEVDGHVGYLPKPYIFVTGKTPEELDSELKPKRASGAFGVLKEVQTQNRTRRSIQTSSTPYYIRGPRGGCYYITGSGRKEYVDRSLCN